MSTLSLRKVKHDSASVDNITLNTDGGVGIGGIDPSTLPTFVDHAVRVQNGGGLGIQSANATDNRWIFFGHGTANLDVQRAGIVNQGSDQSLALTTAGTQRLIVDAVGRVNMPYQPFFTVRQPANQTTTGGTGFYFHNYSDVIHNVGSHFNNSTGRFTAPITGVYLFRGIIMGTDPNDQSPHCGFSINGNANTGGGSYPSNAMWEHPNSASHKTDTMHLIKLNANDNIRLIQLSSVTISQADRTYFMGYLLG